MTRLHIAIESRIEEAKRLYSLGEMDSAFRRLEEAHVLGQNRTVDHTRAHWLMSKVAVKKRDMREIWGQIIRLIGAVTKTQLGIYPKGNTGGANVWFFKPMPIRSDLRAILQDAKLEKK